MNNTNNKIKKSLNQQNQFIYPDHGYIVKEGQKWTMLKDNENTDLSKLIYIYSQASR